MGFKLQRDEFNFKCWPKSTDELKYIILPEITAISEAMAYRVKVQECIAREGKYLDIKTK